MTLEEMREEVFNLILDLDEIDFLEFAEETGNQNESDIRNYLKVAPESEIIKLLYYYGN